MEADQRFPKRVRLRKRREFLLVQGQGAKLSADPLLALVLRNGLAQTRLGITVSTKVGKAVVRTRLRRQLRELFRKRKDSLPKGLDVVLIARTSAANAPFKTLERAFLDIMRKLSGRFP
jgi:ribonuclease P protein component